MPGTTDSQTDTLTARGTVDHIHIAANRKPAPMQSIDEVEAVAGRGFRGDRYFLGKGKHDVREDLVRTDATFVEAEAIEACERDHGITIEPGETRRNVTTRDAPLNHLVDRDFWVGDAKFHGVEICEPCLSLSQWIGEEEVIQALLHRGGLNADIVESGMVRVGDAIRY